ncbi:hypothetical protein PAI11_29320 [Patulibacter medicamentivorans]|uniref:Peptidase C51 domain-containing protein n=1 Tax=Patulibacter medicamentivorans TaxID=1097667 RepID=H0E7X5_9ACTN|nr:CHAP domain-containing protein [Patulibacter medicamentivorans]EHN10173.1 hypothetical protein PAI11_29320 [Patulibacter medicamentivorans]
MFPSSPRAVPARSIAVAATFGAALLLAPAAADAATGTVTVNKGYSLSARSAPLSTASKVRQLANGSRVTIVCQTQGSRVSGRFGTSTLWDKLAGGGYVSDTFVYTGSDGRVAPDCGSKPKPPKPAPPAPTGNVASVTLRDDYPYRGQGSGVDPWNFYKGQCTSFVAWRLSRNIPGFGNGMGGGRFGNANTWDDNARRLGYLVNSSPTVGSVMVRNSGRWGHVAVVAKVKAGKVLLEEYNHVHKDAYSQRWVARTSDLRYIHFDRRR